jgi:hypothetical protein
MFEESGMKVVLELRQNTSTGRVAGTLDIVGAATQLEGKVEGSRIVIDKMDGQPIAAGGVTIIAENADVLLSIQRRGADPVRWRMTRVGSPPASQPGARAQAGGARGAAPAPAATAPSTGFRNATANEFAGEWHLTAPDNSAGEQAELQISGNSLQGAITAYSRGYFTGNVTVDSRLAVQGTYRNGSFDVRLTNQQSGGTTNATLRMRGEYLVLIIGPNEVAGYAREGRPLESNAQNSAEAVAFVRAIQGRVYSTSQQASGRGGFVGGRVKVAFCSDGSMSYDSSNLGDTGAMPGGGVSMGSTRTRRGRWSVVLYAGAPAVRANWDGTGTSYSLIEYFRVRPAADGRSAVVDGVQLPMTDSC